MAQKNVLEFGANPDGITDCYDALKAAVLEAEAEGGGSIYFPRGTYAMSRHDQYSGLYLSSGKPITFVGDGAGISVLKMLPATPGGFFLIRVRSARTSFLGLTFDGSQDTIQATHEQTHLLQIEQSRRIIVKNCEFKNVKGDGIKIVGESATNPVDDMLIDSSSFLDCGRSGITCQRSFKNTRIVDNYFTRINDQSIDFEPTGGGAPRQIVIANNIIDNTNGSVAVALSGVSGVDLTTDILFESNVINNGYVFSTDNRNLAIRGNRISAPSGKAALELSRAQQDIVIEGNILSANGGPVISLFGANERIPNGVLIEGNILTTWAYHGIVIEGSRGVVVKGNRLTDASLAGITGINIRSTLFNYPCQDILIEGNQISGFNTGVSLAASPENMSDIKVSNNQFTHRGSGGKVGISAQAVAGKSVSKVLVSDNQFGTGIAIPMKGLYSEGVPSSMLCSTVVPAP